jgi:hypothetical protein
MVLISNAPCRHTSAYSSGRDILLAFRRWRMREKNRSAKLVLLMCCYCVASVLQGQCFANMLLMYWKKRSSKLGPRGSWESVPQGRTESGGILLAANAGPRLPSGGVTLKRRLCTYGLSVIYLIVNKLLSLSLSSSQKQSLLPEGPPFFFYIVFIQYIKLIIISHIKVQGVRTRGFGLD